MRGLRRDCVGVIDEWTAGHTPCAKGSEPHRTHAVSNGSGTSLPRGQGQSAGGPYLCRAAIVRFYVRPALVWFHVRSPLVLVRIRST